MSEDFGNDYVVLMDQDGKEVEFEHIDSLEHNNEVYVALMPVMQDPMDIIDADGELVILKVVIEEESGDEILSTIDDDDEYDEVAAIFEDRLGDLYEIES